MPRDVKNKRTTVHSVARSFFKTAPDWVTFFREVFGVDGIVRSVFTDPKSLAEFELTKEYDDLQRMLAELRERADILPPEEPNRVITIRLPRSLHESLMAEAYTYRTSMNKLCISKLMRIIDGELIPNDKFGPPKPATSEETV